MLSTTIFCSAKFSQLTARTFHSPAASWQKHRSSCSGATRAVHEPFHVARGCCSEFNHLLERWQDRINLITCLRLRNGDAKIGIDVCADRIATGRAPARVRIGEKPTSHHSQS